MTAAGRGAALAIFVLLSAFTCTSNTSGTNQNTPGVPQSSASTATSTSTPVGTASSPSATTTTPPSTPSHAALAITSLPFHGGEVGIGYGVVKLGAGGGTPPYSWSISGGSLPAGLSLSSGGQVSGTPGAAGQPSFTVMVTDSAGGTATGPGSIKIAAALAVTQPCAGQCSMEEGCTICGNFGAVSGGQGPFAYAITADNRPTGMGVSGLSLTGAVPAPGPIGQFNLTVRVTDAYGAQQADTANWFVFSHINFTVASATCAGSYLAPCSVTIPYIGGTPGVSPKVTVVKIACDPTRCTGGGNGYASPNSMPNLSVGAANGQVTFTVPPHCGFITPNVTGCGNGGWLGTITIQLTDQSPCGPGNCASGQLTVALSILPG